MTFRRIHLPGRSEFACTLRHRFCMGKLRHQVTDVGPPHNSTGVIRRCLLGLLCLCTCFLKMSKKAYIVRRYIRFVPCFKENLILLSNLWIQMPRITFIYLLLTNNSMHYFIVDGLIQDWPLCLSPEGPFPHLNMVCVFRTDQTLVSDPSCVTK